ncbi:hypothetical protein PbJCM13498_03420 [Prolixibacter bellariivorans]|uniref:Uncharacterized protein n=1 Tax=Prolixibacter bellariivorans TaxID=314319 RepID=A0A5M4AU47_9BACT|nr:hypothetical protein [Prolixibacter bellariivorans]GET31479.1 hypothetical protein PbJCM13498_03420 [Prolixibacter bellariivorans]
MNDKLVSLFKLEQIVKKNLESFDKSSLVKEIPSFKLCENINPQYVKPDFTELMGRIKEGNNPKVILISAAGATGKSELTKYLSSSLQMPVFNLSQHKPVASNSLTGLFFDTLGHVGLGKFVEGLKTGKATLIIDALDEGYIKTTVQGFNSFLDEIVNICGDADGIPFVLLGRTQVMEHCWLYLEENGVETSLLKIEPFTVAQANEFIDKQIDERKFPQEYKKTRDYIIKSVEGFFKNTAEIKHRQYQSFIGYAPVLLSITKLLRAAKNYHALYEDLVRDDFKGVDLITSIVQYILLRDKEEKIDRLVLPSLLGDRTPDFRQNVLEKAYSVDEQCIRLLYSQISKPYQACVSEDAKFNALYEDKISEWIKEHPFLENNKIQNAVFESYIIAKMIGKAEYEEAVFEYLKTKYKDAFMLFFIFERLNDEHKINPKFLPFLYSSIKSLDDKQFSTCMSIDEIDEDTNSIHCEVEFSNIQEDPTTFDMALNRDTGLYLNSVLSNVFVNAGIDIVLDGKRCELSSPITLNCNNIIISTDEFVLEKGVANSKDGIVFECESCQIDYANGQVPSLINHLGAEQKFQIITKNRPEFPFVDFYEPTDLSLQITDPLLKDKYLKLRKIIALFRSHSKGRMAKFRDKIENRRVTGNIIGEKVLEELIDKKILYSDDKFYYIDPEYMHEHLGVSYNDIKLRIINDKTIDFLNNIDISE